MDGKILAEARKAQGLTQEELAEIIHMSTATIKRWESLDKFPISVLKKVSTLPWIDTGKFDRGKIVLESPDTYHSVEGLKQRVKDLEIAIEALQDSNETLKDLTTTKDKLISEKEEVIRLLKKQKGHKK